MNKDSFELLPGEHLLWTADSQKKSLGEKLWDNRFRLFLLAVSLLGGAASWTATSWLLDNLPALSLIGFLFGVLFSGLFATIISLFYDARADAIIRMENATYVITDRRLAIVSHDLKKHYTFPLPLRFDTYFRYSNTRNSTLVFKGVPGADGDVVLYRLKEPDRPQALILEPYLSEENQHEQAHAPSRLYDA